jgi:predicted O-linked N-acetylglucosamine transferase (SPINDLY family)
MKQLIQRLQQHDIDPARVSLLGSVARKTYLAAHSEVDMVLDTFPYPGGTTTCEALWMGVPTLTLAGDTLLARQGASLLTAAGLESWIATSIQDYVDRALALAGDVAALAALRGDLREQVRTSPLFDAPRFAHNLEDALWGMWRASRDSGRIP